LAWWLDAFEKFYVASRARLIKEEKRGLGSARQTALSGTDRVKTKAPL